MAVYFHAQPEDSDSIDVHPMTALLLRAAEDILNEHSAGEKPGAGNSYRGLKDAVSVVGGILRPRFFLAFKALPPDQQALVAANANAKGVISYSWRNVGAGIAVSRSANVYIANLCRRKDYPGHHMTDILMWSVLHSVQDDLKKAGRDDVPVMLATRKPEYYEAFGFVKDASFADGTARMVRMLGAQEQLAVPDSLHFTRHPQP